jgi:hypothetical protein
MATDMKTCLNVSLQQPVSFSKAYLANDTGDVSRGDYGIVSSSCGNLQQSARTQVEAWLPSIQAVTEQWTGYLATKQWRNSGLVTWQRLPSYPTVQTQ